MNALNGAIKYKQFLPSWTRVQFVDWAKKRYPNASFSKWSKKRLIALYYNTK